MRKIVLLKGLHWQTEHSSIKIGPWWKMRTGGKKKQKNNNNKKNKIPQTPMLKDTVYLVTISRELFLQMKFIYTIIQKFGVGKVVYTFCIVSLCTHLHLFDQNTLKTVILRNIITIYNKCFLFKYILKRKCIPLMAKMNCQHHYSSL